MKGSVAGKRSGTYAVARAAAEGALRGGLVDARSRTRRSVDLPVPLAPSIRVRVPGVSVKVDAAQDPGAAYAVAAAHAVKSKYMAHPAPVLSREPIFRLAD